MSEITRSTIIEAAQRAAAQRGGPLSRSDFERLSGIGQHHVYRLFPEGGWSEVKRLAGLERHPKDNEPLTEHELLAEFH
ncbi:MAG: hypothetical protein M3P24_10580, partial [Gemmatimonadota bacterium]|nr:hypothetical protein [Gemmatimonadota bacterium]